MRRGTMVGTVKTAESSPELLAELMVGRKVLLEVEKKPATPGKVVLSVENLKVKDEHGVERLKGVSFEIRAGEILGIAGVSGNGQSELLEALGGIARATGKMTLNGAELPLTGSKANGQTRREAGIAHVPEDRQHLGLIMDFTAWENMAFGYHNDPKYQKNALFMDNDAMRADTEKKMATFDVRPPIPTLQAKSFSGGNQQKLVLAREMEQDPDLLLIGQPTRGVDIGAIEFIHKQIIALRDQGKAILLVSVELDEIMSLSDRIAVMFDGQIMGFADPETTNERELGLLMAGVAGRLRNDDKTSELGRCGAGAAGQPAVGGDHLGAGAAGASAKARPRRLRSWWTAPLESANGWGYTLYYTTSFIFTGLGGDRGLSCGPFQHRRRRSGADGRAWAWRWSAWRCPGRIGRWRCWRPRSGLRCLARPGRRCRPICRPSAAAIS